jgi:hypothetical protein
MSSQKVGNPSVKLLHANVRPYTWPHILGIQIICDSNIYRGILCNSANIPKSDERSTIPLAVGCAPELDVVVLPRVLVACPKIGVL